MTDVTTPGVEAGTDPPRLTVSHAYLQSRYRRDSVVIVLLPAVGFALAVVWMMTIGIRPLDVALVVVTYTITVCGIDLGYHRYFAHRAFETTPTVRVLLAIAGAMAAQGRLVRWVSNHRRHHAYSDRVEDPHSPHAWPSSGPARTGRLAGLWHAHVGWIFTHEPSNSLHFARDIIGDTVLAAINRWYLAWILLAAALPAALAGIVRQSALGVIEGILWGWAVPVFLSQHAAFAVNSIGHWVGRRPFATADRSTNVAWLAVPSIGASWQNNHHAFPSAAVTGIEWWQLDLGGWVLRLLERFGLIWDVVRARPEQIAARRSVMRRAAEEGT